MTVFPQRLALQDVQPEGARSEHKVSRLTARRLPVIARISQRDNNLEWLGPRNQSRSLPSPSHNYRRPQFF